MWTTYYTITFLTDFGQHTILWLFLMIVDDILYYYIFDWFWTTYYTIPDLGGQWLIHLATTCNAMTFLSHFGRHTILWLFCLILDDILYYDFFDRFWTTYYTMTFFNDFGRHTILWLFWLTLDDILYYDFFDRFGTKCYTMTFWLILDDLFSITFLGDFGRHTLRWFFD